MSQLDDLINKHMGEGRYREKSTDSSSVSVTFIVSELEFSTMTLKCKILFLIHIFVPAKFVTETCTAALAETYMAELTTLLNVLEKIFPHNYITSGFVHFFPAKSGYKQENSSFFHCLGKKTVFFPDKTQP